MNKGKGMLSLDLNKVKAKNSLCAYDENTGQPLFKPKITRGPTDDKDKEFRIKLDICTRMYYFMYVHQERQKEYEEKEYLKIKEKANKKWMNERSKKIFEKMHFRKLKELFDLIDSDKDGEISENSFNQASLSAEVMAILRPLIKLGKNLSFNDFLEHL